MKKRIIAIALVLMLAVSLLPVTALADEGIYVSVGGKEFTAIDQTINVGGGTAKLTWEYGGKPTLTLNNVNLTSFTKVASQGEVVFYAGIVYAGGYDLTIQINGNCSITAPKHGEKAYYNGIYLECGYVNFEGGAMSIKGTETGVEQYGFTASSGYTYDESNSGVHFANSALNISCSGDDAIYAQGEVALTAKTNISTDYYYGIEAYSVEIYGSTTVNVTPDMSRGCCDAAGISVNRLSDWGSLNVTVNYDSGSRTASEPVTVCGVCFDMANDVYNINSVVNIKGAAKASAYAIVGNRVTFYSGENSAQCNFSGEHYPSAAIMVNEFFSSLYDSSMGIPVVQAIIKGSSAGDIAFLDLCSQRGQIVGTLYASVDSDYAFPIVSKSKDFAKDWNYNPANILTPAGGAFAEIEDESIGSVYTVIDTNREIPRDVIISCNEYPFIDIESSAIAPYKDAIVWANDMKITSGFTPLEFRPSAECNRGQVVTFLWRAKGSPEPTLKENPFVDVKESSPYYKAILWAVEKGITNGYDATHFKPSIPCTRAQVVTFLWRAEGKPAPECDDNPFKDVSASGSTKPYYDAILWAAEQGITGGYTPTEFRPNNICNRGQIVTFIYRDMKDSITRQPDVKKIVNVSIDTEIEPTDDMLCIDYTHEKITPVASFPVVCKVNYSDGTSEDIVLNINQKVEEMPENWAELVAFTDYNVYIRYYAYELYQAYGTDDRWSILGFDVRNLEITLKDAADEIIKTDDGSLLVLEYANPVEDHVLRTVNRLDLNTGKYEILLPSICGQDWKLVGDKFYYVDKTTVMSGQDIIGVYYEIKAKYLSTGLYEIIGEFTESQPVLDGTGYSVTQIIDGEEVTTHYDFP